MGGMNRVPRRRMAGAADPVAVEFSGEVSDWLRKQEQKSGKSQSQLVSEALAVYKQIRDAADQGYTVLFSPAGATTLRRRVSVQIPS